MISVDGLAVEFGGTTLFSDIAFVINEDVYKRQPLSTVSTVSLDNCFVIIINIS